MLSINDKIKINIKFFSWPFGLNKNIFSSFADTIKINKLSFATLTNFKSQNTYTVRIFE